MNFKPQREPCQCRANHPDPLMRPVVMSRIVGYYSPLAEWNDGKKAEFAVRRTFDISNLIPGGDE